MLDRIVNKGFKMQGIKIKVDNEQLALCRMEKKILLLFFKFLEDPDIGGTEPVGIISC